ncbi:MAG TPA: DUF1207 domain-containing protein [Pirellulales bacterium]
MSPGRGRTAVVVCCAALAAVIAARAGTVRADMQLEELPRTMVGSEPVIQAVPAPSGSPVAVITDGQMPPPVGYPAGGIAMAEAIAYDAPWSWQILPVGLIWHSYLAGVKEPRMGSVFNYQPGLGWVWDATAGGRVGLLRYGTPNGFRPEGWQLDLEGAAFPQLLMQQNWDMHSTDFRVGVPLTYGIGPVQFKFEVYHLSSHLGDEFMLSHPTVQRINYSRNALVFGTSYYATDNIRLYGEVGWAFYADGGSEPWELQFGAEYSPIYAPSFRGSPFAAINGHLRQEVAFGGALTVQVGWQWLNGGTGTRVRAGFQYLNGKNEQYQFFNQYVQQFGFGIWYDY